MVKTTDQSSGSSVAMTDESNFLKSIDAFQKKGVECGTVKVTGMYPDRFHDNKSSIGIELSIIVYSNKLTNNNMISHQTFLPIVFLFLYVLPQ